MKGESLKKFQINKFVVNEKSIAMRIRPVKIRTPENWVFRILRVKSAAGRRIGDRVR